MSGFRPVLALAAAATAIALATPGRAVAASDVSPGDPIVLTASDGDTFRCTLGPVLPDGRALTAGHCGPVGSEVRAQGLVVGRIVRSTYASTVADAVGENGIPDWALIDATGRTATLTPLVNGRIPDFDRTPDAAELDRLVGAPVCQRGAVTGESCGRLLGAPGPDFAGLSGTRSDAGDSGAPSWISDGDRIRFVGTLSDAGAVMALSRVFELCDCRPAPMAHQVAKAVEPQPDQPKGGWFGRIWHRLFG